MKNKNKQIIGIIIIILVAIAVAAAILFWVYKAFLGPKTDIYSGVWIWEKTVMNDGTTITPDKPGAFSLNFVMGGRVSGKTDCNDFTGNFSIPKEGNMAFNQLASTEMFCQDSQENIFLDEIQNVDSYLINKSGNLVLNLKLDSGSIYFKKQ
ncbi:MAG TPA: META domain-containing protein [Candidatus Staskawiczbacteria bacterium]|nr:META domain-containing protein [Candidatus Staskawiczbacteria bacterium]